MKKKYRRDLPNTNYKKQLLKVIWSVMILATIIVAKAMDTDETNEFISMANKIVNYDLKLNDKRLVKLGKAITSFNISSSTEDYAVPMQGTIHKKFEESKKGIDIVAYKEFVYSIGSGEVIDISEGKNGIDVTATHGELKVVYGNMEKINVKNGEILLKGHILGSMGDISRKNKYFHFEIWKNGIRVDPLDYIKVNSQIPLSYD